jgi:hypothetical protein
MATMAYTLKETKDQCIIFVHTPFKIGNGENAKTEVHNASETFSRPMVFSFTASSATGKHRVTASFVDAKGKVGSLSFPQTAPPTGWTELADAFGKAQIPSPQE